MPIFAADGEETGFTAREPHPSIADAVVIGTSADVAARHAFEASSVTIETAPCPALQIAS